MVAGGARERRGLFPRRELGPASARRHTVCVVSPRYVLNVTSQRWRTAAAFAADSPAGCLWRHQLIVVVPDAAVATRQEDSPSGGAGAGGVGGGGTGWLWVTGGHNNAGGGFDPLPANDTEVATAALLAVETGQVAAVLKQVPTGPNKEASLSPLVVGQRRRCLDRGSGRPRQKQVLRQPLRFASCVGCSRAIALHRSSIETGAASDCCGAMLQAVVAPAGAFVLFVDLSARFCVFFGCPVLQAGAKPAGALCVRDPP